MHYRKIPIYVLCLAILPIFNCDLPPPILKHLSPCPEKFISDDGSQTCMLLLENTSYPPQCPYKGNVPFEVYKDLIIPYLPIWLPLEKNITNYGFEPFKWTEISDLFGTELTYYYTYEGFLNDKNCVIYTGNDAFQAVSCNEKYNAVCVYKQIHHRHYDYCQLKYGNLCIGSNYNLDAKCACMYGTYVNGKLFEFLQPYQNYIYTKLPQVWSHIGLEVKHGDGYWKQSKIPLNYSFWSEDVNYTCTYGAMTPKGWILLDNATKLHYSLYNRDIVLYEPTITIEYYVSTDLTITISITHYKELYYQNECYPLITCFSDASPSKISCNFFNSIATQIVPVTTGSTLTYTIRNNDIFTGNYYCMGFKSTDLTPVFSKNIPLYSIANTCEFVGIFNKTYPEDVNPFTDASNLHKTFFNILDGKTTPRLFKIVNIEEKVKEITFNMHFTVSNVNCIKYYINYKGILEERTKKIDINLISSTMTEYCLGKKLKINTNLYLTVPSAKIGATVLVREYCFLKSGKRMRITCKENFIDGADWIIDNDNCTILDSSNYTILLDNILDDETNATWDEAGKVSQCYESLTALDVSLLVSIIEKKSTESDARFVLDIIDNIMKITDGILNESQDFFKSTDRLLRVINIVTTYEFSKQKWTNFAVITLKAQGIALDKDNNIYQLNDRDIEKIKHNPSIITGLILSKPLFENLTNTKTLVYIFFKSSIFQDVQSKIIPTNTIYGIKTSKPPEYPFIIFNKNRKLNDNCISYKLSPTNKHKSFWDLYGNQNDLGCLYKEVGFFSLANIQKSVTESLKYIYEDESLTIQERLGKLKDIIDNYTGFTPEDINYISQILELAAHSSEYNLKQTTSIISNLLNVNPDVLKKSQTYYNATDRILFYTDQIVIKPETDEMHSEERFAVVIIKLSDTNVTGITLDNCTKSCNINVVKDTVKTLENIDAAVILSDELLEQLLNKDNTSFIPKLVITIYYSAFLFVDDHKKGIPSIVFGVQLPDFEDDFLGNVSVVYNMTDVVDNTCAYWDYNINDYPGFWREEEQRKSSNNFLVCEYPHLTNFAMLLGINIDDKYHLLEIFTDVCCTLSLMGIVGIMMTGLLFKKWRTNTGNHILLNFVTAISLKIILLYINNMFFKQKNINKTKCIVLGSILHYSLISEFCWMLIIAILQFKRFVEVLGGPPKYILVKAYTKQITPKEMPVCVIHPVLDYI
ncbi:unnamed protein product [Brassicogethes aeneus]|uniref:GPS domain-containing protein n=1 Tax=Brassicogethes aeneus TaxID=1431903 RepID=A0A9P0AY76_BRAAE|nr:unnamed protein product [Brassicogethes aeneus]